MVLKELNKRSGTDRVKYLIENKADIVRAKKSLYKSFSSSILPTLAKVQEGTNKSNTAIEGNVFEIVGNSIGFMDSHEDVSMKGSFTKTVKESGANVPILKDHNHSTDGIIGINRGVSVGNKSIRSLGYDRDGHTEVLLAMIEPKYDKVLAQKYLDGQIKQHSIGLQYVKIEVAVNDKSDREGFENWNKYIDSVINREKAEENGYFFAVLEQKLIEISAVVFGSNAYTPTTQEDNKSLEGTEPSSDTQKSVEPIKKGVDFYKLLNS